MNQLRMSIPVKIALFVAFLFLVITLVGVQIEYNKKQEEQEKLLAKMEVVQANIDELQNRLNTPFDEEYIVELAKEKLGYCLPDEIIFVNDLIN